MNLRVVKQGVMALLACLFAAMAIAQTPEVTVTLKNVDSSAWVVKAVQGAEGVAKLNTANTPITLTTGTRYHFINLGTLKIHPLAIRGEDGEPLLGQRPQNRPFETDPEVAFKADNEGMTFTLTPALAKEVSTYYCTAHPTPLMEAPLKIVSP